MRLAVIGGGPAGLRAAEIAAARGLEVTIFDAKRSTGRKLLVAGRGGLNLTHGEDFARFVSRYDGPSTPADFWQRVLEDFTPTMLREWAEELGVETFQQRTGRVYPREMKAAPLLRRWVERLRGAGVKFAMNHQWKGLVPGKPMELHFAVPEGHAFHLTDTVVLALGGASWPVTGSDGTWVEPLRRLGIGVSDLEPANCGWECEWPPELLAIAEGQPLKNIAVRAGEQEATGELMVTAYGLEGGAIYQVGRTLRAMESPGLTIDFKPELTVADLLRKMESVRGDLAAACKERWRLSDAAHAVLTTRIGEVSLEELAGRAKACPVAFTRPRPIDEAISSAGGVKWEELDENLMLRKLSGVFVAGEMIDWEAPTGGYLMQGCFATGTLAGRAASDFLVA